MMDDSRRQEFVLWANYELVSQTGEHYSDHQDRCNVEYYTPATTHQVRSLRAGILTEVMKAPNFQDSLDVSHR